MYKDMNIESLGAAFNDGLVDYEAITIYSYVDGDSTYYSDDSEELASNFGCDPSELSRGFFFLIKE